MTSFENLAEDIFEDETSIDSLVNSSEEIKNNLYNEEGEPKRHRGRPKGSTNNSGTSNRTTRAVDDLSEEEISWIFDNYSQIPIDEICSKMNLHKRTVTRIMNTIMENFKTAIAHNDLTEEEFSKFEHKFKIFEVKKIAKPIDAFAYKFIKNIKSSS